MTRAPDDSRAPAPQGDGPPPSGEARVTAERPSLLEDLSPTAARVISALVLVTWLLGAGLTQSLPGTFAGANGWISGVLYGGAFCSQFLASLGALMCLRSASALMSAAHFGVWPRVLSFLTTVGTVFCVLFAAQPHDNVSSPSVLGTQAVLACTVLLQSGILALSRPEVRGPGLVALSASSAGFVFTAAELLTWIAAEQANVQLFRDAQIVATVGFAGKIVTLVLASMWLLTRNGLAPRLCLGLAVGIAPALLINTGGRGMGTWVRRTLEQLGSNPIPWVPNGVTAAIQLVCLGGVTAACVSSREKAPTAVSIALILLGFSSPDVPLSALVVCLGALLLMTRTGRSLDPAEQPAEPNEYSARASVS